MQHIRFTMPNNTADTIKRLVDEEDLDAFMALRSSHEDMIVTRDGAETILDCCEQLADGLLITADLIRRALKE